MQIDNLDAWRIKGMLNELLDYYDKDTKSVLYEYKVQQVKDMIKVLE